MFWDTNGVGDGLVPYTEANWIDFLRGMFVYDATTEGVVAGFGNTLAVTGAASPLSVNTGRAVVYGFPYHNDASASLTVATPVVNTTGGHVILRADWTTQQVRLVAVRNTDGVAGIPALTQTPGTTYEIRLASFTITTLGVITLTDTRNYCNFNTALLYRRQGGSATNWDTEGSTNYTPGRVIVQMGLEKFTIANGNQSVNDLITFPQPFTSARSLVMVSAYSAVSLVATPKAGIALDGASPTTRARIYVTRGDLAGAGDEVVYCTWLAIGPV